MYKERGLCKNILQNLKGGSSGEGLWLSPEEAGKMTGNGIILFFEMLVEVYKP